MIRSYIEKLVTVYGISFTELARLTGQSPQNLNNKMRNNSMRASELFKIADVLGLEIHFTDKAGNIIV